MLQHEDMVPESSSDPLGACFTSAIIKVERICNCHKNNNKSG